MEIAKSPFSSTSTSPLCSRRRPPTAPTPAPWRGFPAAFFRRAGPHASHRSSSPSCCLALEPLAVPRVPPRPEATAPPPPRRRGGTPAAQPASLFSRAHQNQGALLDLFPSPSRSFPAQTSWNAAAAPPNAGELKAAVAPPFQSRSAQIDHANSFASLSRSSRATSRRLSSPRTPSRRAPP